MRVLIVEANEALGQLWSRYLCREGFSAKWVDSSDIALTTLSVEEFSVLIVNSNLPKNSALVVSDYAAYRWPDTQVIFVTGSSFFSDGSIFQHSPNARAFVPPTTTPDDLAAMVSFFAVH